jgi:hypothetical protein
MRQLSSFDMTGPIGESGSVRQCAWHGSTRRCERRDVHPGEIVGITRHAHQLATRLSASLSAHAASWKMMPRAKRCPLRMRLTPCLSFTRWSPRLPATGR